MITNEMAARFHLPTIENYPFPELDYYHTFLVQSDYVANKIAEAAYLGETVDEDYTNVLQARKFARKRINEIEVEENGQTVEP